MVPSTVVQESRQRKRRVPTIPTLGREVLGQYQRVLGQSGLGTVRSWDSAALVLRQWSWDSGLGTVQSWDSRLGTVLLRQCSLGTAVLG